MNDFTDDSAMKFYLNKRGGAKDTSLASEEGTLSADISVVADSDVSVSDARKDYLSASSSASSVSLDRFSSPAMRFAIQLVIHPEELPDSMAFDPHMQVIVFKDTLHDRLQSSTTINPGISEPAEEVSELPQECDCS